MLNFNRGFLQLAFSCQILPNIAKNLSNKNWQNVGVEPLTPDTEYLAPALYTWHTDTYPTVLDHYCFWDEYRFYLTLPVFV